MIVVVGSRHDPVATRLVASWPQAALCSAEDLVSQGWVWRHNHPKAQTWIVNGKRVRDTEVHGVFIRRSAVYAEELVTTHPADRGYLASETHAFLTVVLATTRARVVNPVRDGAFGEEALRPACWISAASEVGITTRPVRLTSEPRRQAKYRTYEIEVVGGEVFGEAQAKIRAATRHLVEVLGIAWAKLLFDARDQLIVISGASSPSERAVAALGRLLEGKSA